MAASAASATGAAPATEERPCRACNSMESFTAAKGGVAKKKAASAATKHKPVGGESGDGYTDTNGRFPCPPDSVEIGRSTWTFLHTMAAYYPEKPTREDQKAAATFFRTFSRFYPCSYCASHLRTELASSPPVVSSNLDMSLWLCALHNKVNERLGKPVFDCSRVLERWRDGGPGDDC
ncbi:hypothetical protein HK405_007335 [Cladochytrium tenue]|nr:hypothetical protein HK405_007335 [Cladochytrium tenue]